MTTLGAASAITTGNDAMQDHEPSGTQDESELMDDLVGRSLRQWREARPDIDISGKAVVGRLMYLANLAHQTLEAALASADLTYYEYSVLSSLRVVGAPWELSPSVLKSTLLFTSGGLSNLLKRLENRQFIVRADNPHDGRGVLVRLTRQGKSLIDAVMPGVSSAKLDLIRMLNARERTTLVRLLRRMGLGMS